MKKVRVFAALLLIVALAMQTLLPVYGEEPENPGSDENPLHIVGENEDVAGDEKIVTEEKKEIVDGIENGVNIIANEIETILVEAVPDAERTADAILEVLEEELEPADSVGEDEEQQESASVNADTDSEDTASAEEIENGSEEPYEAAVEPEDADEKEASGEEADADEKEASGEEEASMKPGVAANERKEAKKSAAAKKAAKRAAKKPAAKKTAAKRPAVKKPAVKKTAVNERATHDKRATESEDQAGDPNLYTPTKLFEAVGVSPVAIEDSVTAGTEDQNDMAYIIPSDIKASTEAGALKQVVPQNYAATEDQKYAIHIDRNYEAAEAQIQSNSQTQPGFTVESEKEGDKVLVSVGGRLDTTSAPQLQDELDKSLKDAKELVIDMADVDYISSAGLRVLLSAQKTMSKQGKMILRNVKPEVKEVFDITGFSDILTIE